MVPSDVDVNTGAISKKLQQEGVLTKLGEVISTRNPGVFVVIPDIIQCISDSAFVDKIRQSIFDHDFFDRTGKLTTGESTLKQC